MDDFDNDEEFWQVALSIKQKDSDSTSDNDEKNNDEKDIDIDLSLLKVSDNQDNPNKLYITPNGIYLDVSHVDPLIIKQLCNKFMVKTKANFGNKWNVARGFNVIKRPNQIILLLPRFGFLNFYFKTLIQESQRQRKLEYANMVLLKKFGLSGLSNIINQIPHKSPNSNITSVGLSLADHQKKIIDYMMVNYYNNINQKYGFAGLNLKVKTGAGKSYIAFGLIDRLKLPTLYVVHNQPQAEDIYTLLKKYFPNTSIGMYNSSKKILGDIMVVVIHSACGSDEYTFTHLKKTTTFEVIDFYSRYGLVIFDESHKYCSPEFSKVYSRCQSTIMLGLSATPGERLDGFDPITYWNVGSLVDIVKKIPDILVDEPFHTKILGLKYSGSSEFTAYKVNEYGMFDNNATLIQMMEDPHRLDIIVKLLEYFTEHKRNVYIFSDRLEYLFIIRRKFFDKLKINNKKINMLDEEIIEFMKNQPTYAKYVEELYKSMIVKENSWFNSSLQIANFTYYLEKLKLDAQNKVNEISKYYNEILQEEKTQEYYDNLLITYKNNFVDDYIEDNTTLSVLTGGSKGEQINNSVEKATMIFTTYGYMGTGKSIPKMDTILPVTPRRNGFEQVIGRIFRPGPNKNVRWLVDLVDWKINLKSQWYERLNVYEKQKEQNRNPILSEFDVDFEENVDNMTSKLNKVFIDTSLVNKPVDEMKFNFQALNLNTTPSKKKIRIINKF